VKPLEIHDQPILGLARTLSITANGIRYRLFRSLVTVVVVTVAVAFLMNIVSESLIRKSIAERTSRRIAELRVAANWAGRLTDPGNIGEILQAIAARPVDDPLCREAAGMGGLSDEELRACHDGARRAALYLQFFDEVDYARRRQLVHNATGVDIFARLRRPAAWERFTTALPSMRSVRFPTPVEAFATFLQRWAELEAQTVRIRRGRARAVAAVAERLKGRPVIDALAETDGAFGEFLRGLGFSLDAATAAQVAGQARRMVEARTLEKTIADPQMRKAVASRLDVLPGDVTVRTLWGFLREQRRASWYLERQKALGGEAAELDVRRAVELAELEAETRALTRAERIRGPGSGLMGIGERMTWLVLASLLVCGVGISNAMLMSVTERFREIATLKCLGALDGFIMLTFVLEASFLGLVGGVVGAAMGSGLGLGRMLLPYGTLVMASLPAGELVAAMGLSVVLGIVLAALASIYPSFKAATLAPMEAMRIQ